MKRLMGVCIAAAVFLVVVFVPGFPWSARAHRTVKRILLKAELRVAEWRGHQPREVLLTGRLRGYGAQLEALKGARISAAESPSGYSALSDNDGRFVLPHLLWYPGASYNLLVAADEYHCRRFKVTALPGRAQENVVDVGELRFDDGYEAGEETPLRSMEYDSDNSDYYKAVFARRTANLESDEAKIDAINKHVAARLNYGERAPSFKSPRQILERGSCYCSNLALAMAALTQAGGYPTRAVHLSDSPQHQNTHVVVEVYYGDQWHLYDPTYGVFFANRLGAVASYRELRLDPDLVAAQAFQALEPELARSILDWMPGAYRAGFHQVYQGHKSELCGPW